MATKLVGQDGSPVKYQGKDVFSCDYSGVVKSVDMMKRTLIMTGTDETKDRDGDIIRLSGWNMDNYKKNPVFLWAHNYGSVPLARAEKVTKKKEPPRMEFLLQFPTKGIYPFADMILELYEEKIINASSVGFIPMKWNPIEEDNKDGHNRVQYGREYMSQELLELSGCAVPSNPSAVQNALKGKSFGFKADDLLKYLTGATLIPRPEKEDDIIDELDKSETEIVDETTIQVQVPEQLETPAPLTEDQKEVEESLIKIPNLETGHVESLKDIPIEEAEMLGDGDILKPYPNEHACRLADPSEFEKFARKNCFRKVADKCVDYIFGIKGDKTTLQAMRFNKDVWSESGAKVVCERVGGKFDAAKPPKSEDPPLEISKPEEELKVDFSVEISNINEEVRKIKEELLISNQTLESMVAEIKGIQDSLAKALEEIQRKPSSGSSSYILQDAFNQGRGKAENLPTEKYSKESLDSLRSALVEVAKAMKNIKL